MSDIYGYPVRVPVSPAGLACGGGWREATPVVVPATARPLPARALAFGVVRS